MADGQVKVPIIGETNKSTLFIAGIAGVTALGWAWWKQKKSAKETAATASTAVTGAQQGPGYAYGYGAYNYQPYGYGFGNSGLGEYGGGQGNYGYGYYGAGEPVNEEVPAAASNNAQWSEAAMTALTSAGWASQDVLTALGLYITGSPVSATQASIIQAAIAAEGYPPSPGTTGYPPAINQSASTGQSGTTPATGAMVTVPQVAGQTAANAQITLKNAGLIPVITLDAASNKKGIFHIVTKTVPAAGTSVSKGSQVTLYYSDSKSAAS